MTKILVTMGGEQQGERINTRSTNARDYEAEAVRLARSAVKYGFVPIIWDNAALRATTTYADNRAIMDQPAFGWLFKPYEIRQAMAKAANGTIVMWVDSSHTFISDPAPVIEWAAAHDGFFIHDHLRKHPCKAWTRRSTFVLMDCDSERFWNANQMQVNQLTFIKSPRTMQFVEEWLRWCCDPRVMLGCEGYDELPEFAGKDPVRDHRHEQAVLSILVEKYCMVFAPYKMSTDVFDESEILCP